MGNSRFSSDFTGDLFHQAVREYTETLPENDEIDEIGFATPCWEMGSHDAAADQVLTGEK